MFRVYTEVMSQVTSIKHADNSYMRTLENSDYPDEMPHNEVFHLGLNFVLRQ